MVGENGFPETPGWSLPRVNVHRRLGLIPDPTPTEPRVGPAPIATAELDGLGAE